MSLSSNVDVHAVAAVNDDDNGDDDDDDVDDDDNDDDDLSHMTAGTVRKYVMGDAKVTTPTRYNWKEVTGFSGR